jgi:hypothetical protein
MNHPMTRTALLEQLVGVSLVVVGVAQVHPPSAFIVAGVALCGLSVWTEKLRR